MPSVALINESLTASLGEFLVAAGAKDVNVAKTERGRITDTHGEAMIPANEVVSLFEDLSAQMKNPAFGLAYAQAFPLGGTGAFGFILTQAKDMRTAVKAATRYVRLVMPNVDARYEAIEGGGQFTWRYPLSAASPHVQFNSFVAALVILRLRAGLNPEWNPLSVQLAHREPGNLAAYRKMFGHGVAFEQPVNRFKFRDVNLDRPNPGANPRLFEVVKQLGDILLASRTKSADFRALVANEIVDQLGVTSPTLEAVALQLGMGQRSVQRRLAGEGTTFETVVGETRKSVAERMLRDTNLSLTDIAFMLGFSELSAFIRASNRWFGMTPREFRSGQRRSA
ncbi:MAG: AraC family transcriptional regulator ligand-binding domain-containing protein [Hyphomicrobium sp.]